MMLPFFQDSIIYKFDKFYVTRRQDRNGLIYNIDVYYKKQDQIYG